MALLFAVAVVLLGWRTARYRPLDPVPFIRTWELGEQVLPLAVPVWRQENPRLAGGGAEIDLERRAVSWSAADDSSRCVAYFRVSLHHWARRPVSPPVIPDDAVSRRYSMAVSDFFDDDDGDGDPLDSGELLRQPAGFPVEVFCAGAGSA
ncbi:MAG: hypothetical protein AAF604_00310 [Acidobacteriota bacterium]